MLSVSEIVAKTEAMFDIFNHHFYNGELTRPAITVSPDGGRGAYGWCSVYEIWQASGEAYREINICAEYIDRPIGEVAATMLHKMAHLYNLNHEIKNVSNIISNIPHGNLQHVFAQLAGLRAGADHCAHTTLLFGNFVQHLKRAGHVRVHTGCLLDFDGI